MQLFISLRRSELLFARCQIRNGRKVTRIKIFRVKRRQANACACARLARKSENKCRSCKRTSGGALKMIFSRSSGTPRLVTALRSVHLASVMRLAAKQSLCRLFKLLGCSRASRHPERNLHRHVIPTSRARRNSEGWQRQWRRRRERAQRRERTDA